MSGGLGLLLIPSPINAVRHCLVSLEAARDKVSEQLDQGTGLKVGIPGPEILGTATSGFFLFFSKNSSSPSVVGSPD